MEALREGRSQRFDAALDLVAGTRADAMSAIEAAFFGVLGRDAEAKVSKAGKQYLRMVVRVGDGDAAQWVNTCVFDETAIAAADRLTKGARVYVEGSIKLDEWVGADGAVRHGLSCLSWHCRLPQIGRNKPRRARAPVADRPAADPDLDDDIGF